MNSTKKNTIGRRASKGLSLILAGLLATVIVAGSAQASSRIKDIVTFEGVRDNLLVGYGLVVGLNNTGTSPSKACSPCSTV